MTLVDQLKALAGSLHAELLEPPRPEQGLPVKVAVGPPLPNVEVTQVLTGVLNLTTTVQPLELVQKDVQWSDAASETPSANNPTSFDDLTQAGTGHAILGGLPGVSGIPISAGGTLSQLSGLVASITGTIPFPSTTSLPVSVQVTWSVADAAGTALTDGTDYVTLQGGASAAFLLPPVFYEEGKAPPAATVRRLLPSVVLSAGGTSTPSIPLPAIPISVPAVALAPPVRERFRLSGPAAPLQPGTSGAASLAETGVQNVLSRVAAAFPNVRVTLTYSILRGGTKPPSNAVLGLDKNPLSTEGAILPGQSLGFFLKPTLAALAASPAQEDWALRVTATVKGLPAAGDLHVTLPDLPLLQLGLPVPHLLLAFGGRRFGPGALDRQRTYVFLSPGNPAIASGYVDESSPREAQQLAKDAVLAQLTAVIAVVAQVRSVFGSVLPVLSNLHEDVLGEVIDALSASQVGDVVVDATPACRDVGADGRQARWNDWISSLAVVGLPDSRKLHLYENPDFQGRDVPFAVPAGHLFADYTTIHESWDSASVPAGPFSSDKRGPSLGNLVTSSKWE
jgi:hypothetical protein